MNWPVKYTQNSLFYEPWKTKFIEIFSREYPILVKNIKNTDRKDFNGLYANAMHYSAIFKTALKIMKKKMICEGKNITFYSDVLFESYKNKLINNIDIWFDALHYVSCCFDDKNFYLNFKQEYLDIFEEFKNNMKPFIKQTGFRDNYSIYDNTYCLWGISERAYKKIAEVFLEYEDLKIVKITGSRVTQNYREFSDIDLVSEGIYNIRTFNKLCEHLHKLELPYIIDMNDIYDKTKPFIYRNVMRSNLFYSRKTYYPDDNYTSVLD